MCDRSHLKQPDPPVDEEDGSPAITKTVEGVPFIWDGRRWREMVKLKAQPRVVH
jgi:hypothetical protein